MSNHYNDLIGDILESAGEKDNYKGKGMGKPLPKEYLQRDLFQNFQQKAKDAGYVPQWIKLRKEIAALLETATTEDEIKVINKKIKEYNSLCPTSLQKGMVQLTTLEKAKEIW
ncbi:DUF1992 domain-containing protein [Caldibacillus lycopersici]|uniref:DUF1992 domain-containing protein n=1 Tax=Perspicuibacillus lycopersici TaxID=1325689 RepID=A0AAE3IWK6_9BACI|nr:DUF1992 domain-containing protein [Perspicuibacillus lycopersici]MCU9614721.1 DUF1992 domain-containing protein [Perspicuibacillus lycopersici]